jgi:prevent-host-death family protein
MYSMEVGMVKRVKVSEARQNFSEIVNKVGFGDSEFIVTRSGKDFVAIIPISTFKLLQALEDKIDIQAAREALQDTSGLVTLEEIKAKYSID